MRVLWLCNVMLPMIGEYLEKPYSNGGGWLTGLSEDILKSNKKNLEFAVCFPMLFENQIIKGRIKKEENKMELQFFGFPIQNKNEAIYDKNVEGYLKLILDEYDPDIIHIFGTEFGHTLAMTRVNEKKERIIIGMQGVLAICAQRYEANLPKHIVNRYTFRDLIKRDNIKDGKHKFMIRAKFEEEALNNVTHVLGRTSFDYEETLKINPNRKYYKLNETLREVFYQKRWDISTMERYTIFISQGDYPLKGLHFILQALPEILRRYPDTKLYIAGNQIIPQKSLMGRIKISSYGKYIKKLIHINFLKQHVYFLGSLNAEEMCAQFQKSHVFVCPSVIENSPNSLGEAMLLGMPVVSSKVGGVPDMITNREDGILVESGNVSAFSKAIKDVFAKDELAIQMGLKAHMKAVSLYNREENFNRLLEIYDKIGNDTNED